MLRVQTTIARPGMELALPVFHPRRHDTVLLKKGVSLEPQTIERLKDLKLPEVWIAYPNLELISEYVNPEAQAQRYRTARMIADAFDAFGAHVDAELNFREYHGAMNDLLELLTQRPKTAVFMDEIVESGQPAVRHASNVSYLALLMGLKLDFYLMRERPQLESHHARNVSNLGVAGMLHDIGMRRLDPQTLRRWVLERDETDEAWREHVRIGFRVVRGEIEPSAAAAVLHHHQRFDGEGFPPRITLSGEEISLEGSQIHIYARILAAADLFDRIKNPAHCDGTEDLGLPEVPTVRVHRRMMSRELVGSIDPIVRRALMAVAPPYPPGTPVRLSDGRDAVVVAWDEADPCRPTVELVAPFDDGVFDHDEQERLDLRLDHEIQVARVGEHDVLRDNFYPVHHGQFGLRHKANEMLGLVTDSPDDSGNLMAG